MSELVIGGRTFRSRLFVGTGKFSSNELMARAIAASESEMVTVAMKRIDMNNPQDDMLVHVRRPEIQLLPNTSGVRDAEEAVLAAQLAREAFGTNFIKLEIHPDPKYLLPDPVETLKATEQLAKMGFVVLPYSNLSRLEFARMFWIRVKTRLITFIKFLIVNNYAIMVHYPFTPHSIFFVYLLGCAILSNRQTCHIVFSSQLH